MESCMKKKIIVLAIAGILGSSSLVSFAASNNNEKVEEPLRLRSDREELIEQLTNEKVKQKSNPTTAQEIEELQQETMETEIALESAPHDPTPLFRTIDFKSNNSTEFRDIYLSPNYATTLIFLDKRGNYWPIDSYVLPLPDEVITKDVINTGTMVLTPRKYSAKGNLVVMLKDSKIPLMLTLNVGVEKIDYKTELRIDDYGPNSQLSIYDPATQAPKAYTDLSSMGKYAQKERYELLDGITPNGYKKRETTHNSVEAWSKGKALMIKTKAQLISPSLLEDDEYNFIKGSDGSYLYTVPFMSKILLSMGGNIISVSVK